MKLEQQVCSLDLAKELKTLGVKQESLWYWVFGGMLTHKKEYWTIWLRQHLDLKLVRKDNCYSAFTCTELGEMLPEFIKQKGTNFVLVMRQDVVMYLNSKSKIEPIKIWDDIEANARAKCLTYLLENGIISVGDMNRKEKE